MKEGKAMLKKTADAVMVICLIGVLSGCYGSSVSKMCQVCNDLKEGKTEGTEWSGEYINHKFQCKLDGGKVKVKVEDYWKDCG